MLLWLASGLFMAWFPIEKVRGEHLRAAAPPRPIAWGAEWLGPREAAEAAGLALHEAETVRIGGRLYWRVADHSRSALVDPISGAVSNRLSAAEAVRIARDAYAGAGRILEVSLHDEDTPFDYRRPGPVWAIDFGHEDAARFYVDAQTGEVRAVRTALWRAFDLMWGLHIMDWSSRENFNSWWLKASAAFAVLFALAGAGIMVLRLIPRARPRRGA